MIGALEEMIFKAQEFMASILTQKIFKEDLLVEMALKLKSY